MNLREGARGQRRKRAPGIRSSPIVILTPSSVAALHDRQCERDHKVRQRPDEGSGGSFQESIGHKLGLTVMARDEQEKGVDGGDQVCTAVVKDFQLGRYLTQQPGVGRREHREQIIEGEIAGERDLAPAQGLAPSLQRFAEAWQRVPRPRQEGQRRLGRHGQNGIGGAQSRDPRAGSLMAFPHKIQPE